VDLNVLFTVLGEIGPGAGCVLRNEANSKSADGVHPTATGYRLIATAVFEAIQAARLPHTKIVCFGDSITFGANMDGAGKVEGDTYPGYLARLLAAES
jgi:lysophospholipase L1-like esterase